jgi:hypothetical protein
MIFLYVVEYFGSSCTLDSSLSPFGIGIVTGYASASHDSLRVFWMYALCVMTIPFEWCAYSTPI